MTSFHLSYKKDIGQRTGNNNDGQNRRTPLFEFINCVDEQGGPSRRTPLLDLANCIDVLASHSVDHRSSACQSQSMIVEDEQESEEKCSGSSKRRRTLLAEEPPVSQETAERSIDITVNDNAELRIDLIYRCERIVHDIIEQLCAGQVPSISYRIPTSETLTEQVESLGSDFWSSRNIAESPEEVALVRSTAFDTPESLDIDDSGQVSQRSTREVPGQRNVVSFARRCSRGKFALMMTVLANVHKLLLQNGTETRRSLFYELKSREITSLLANSQQHVDKTVECVASLLECSPWDTGLVATAKGLAAGKLTLTILNNDKVDYDVPGGALIPQNISSIVSIRTKADLVLVVEKDTIFQKLLQEMCPSVLNCVLVTGKGYPDVSTRMLVKVLAERVGLPVYVLVDADPHGLDIMFNYKYGSINLCYDQGSLACPSARWIGVRPSELTILRIPKLNLTEVDLTKLNALASRPYINDEFISELEIMREGKAEIEAVTGLTSMYLPMKIANADYV